MLIFTTIIILTILTIIIITTVLFSITVLSALTAIGIISTTLIVHAVQFIQTQKLLARYIISPGFLIWVFTIRMATMEAAIRRESGLAVILQQIQIQVRIPAEVQVPVTTITGKAEQMQATS